MHNKGVSKDNRLEAWLTFLCEDDPEWILDEKDRRIAELMKLAGEKE